LITTSEFCEQIVNRRGLILLDSDEFLDPRGCIRPDVDAETG
jgi:hypothetical protein